MTTPPSAPTPKAPRHMSWRSKFASAFRGTALAMRQERSFYVHLPAAVAVIGVAAWLDVAPGEWLALLLAITVVLAAELMNTAIERLARAVTRDEHPEVRDALDIASGAVLIAAMGASVVGALILMWHVL